MPSAIFIEIIGVITLLFVLLLASRKMLVESKIQNIVMASIITALLLFTEISLILLSKNPANSVANALKIMLSLILPIILSCLIDDSLYQYKKHLFIPIYFQFAVCTFYIWHKWSSIFIITDTVIQIYSSFLIIWACYHASKHYDTQQKIFLFTISLLVIAGFVIENFTGNFIFGTFIALFLLLYYIFQQEEQMHIDPLTGIQNRWAFDKR